MENLENLLAGNRLEEAVALLEPAIAEAEAAGDKGRGGDLAMDLGRVLTRIGRPDKARDAFLRAWHLLEGAGRPKWQVLESELETLRLDLFRGQVEAALPRLGELLSRLREMRKALSEETSNEVARVLDTALDLVVQAHLQLGSWQPCLDRLSEAETLNRKMGASELEIALLRFHRHRPLLALERADEAEALIEECLAVFSASGERVHEAAAWSALAALADTRGHLDEVLEYERRALSLRDLLPDLSDRGVSHGNLANTLGRLGFPTSAPPVEATILEARRHRLASLIYALLVSQPQVLAQRIRNVSIDYKMAREARLGFSVPTVASLLETEGFEALRAAAAGRDLTQLQAQVDAMVTQVRTWSRVRPMF